MWEHLQLRLADLDVCLLSRVRCGNSWETKGQKQHTGGFVIEALVNMANRPTCYPDHQCALNLWKALAMFENKCIQLYIRGDIGIQWYADIMWS